jgi:flavin reductase (DIM6/NTAB) family NADH-FMN oxidoreductase RutF/DNA-binding MarR family transcriptional regulator
MTDFDMTTFRRALGNFATGITIITAQNDKGEKVGVTANSFNSVSLDPPLVLWSIDKKALSYNIFNSSSHFAVNVLAADQMDLSNHFARQQEDKFSGIEWEESQCGAPLFPHCAARFECELYEQVDAGDHWILLGKVIRFDDFGHAPLCYHQGSYSMVYNHPGTTRKPQEQATTLDSEGRLEGHAIYLMMMAVRAYQEGYIPKQEALGLTITEARCVITLSDKPGLNADGLQTHISSLTDELTEAMTNLCNHGLALAEANGFVLTDSGKAKAEEYWNLADSHATEMLKDFNPEQVNVFKDMLRGIISKGQ